MVLGHGVEQVILVRAIQAFPVVWVAEGADVFATSTPCESMAMRYP